MLMDKNTTAHDAWDDLRYSLIKRIDDSPASETALEQLYTESGTINDLMEQWGKRLEDELCAE